MTPPGVFPSELSGLASLLDVLEMKAHGAARKGKRAAVGLAKLRVSTEGVYARLEMSGYFSKPMRQPIVLLRTSRLVGAENNC